MGMRQEGSLGGDGAHLERLWLQVCQSRGTPAPDPALRGRFLQQMQVNERAVLESILALAVRGREKPGDFGVLSWAAACTRPALLERLAAHGLAFTGAHLFACGLALMQSGWDMPQRLAQLQADSEDVGTLRALLPVQTVQQPLQALDAPVSHEEEAPEAFHPWPDDGPAEGCAPGWQDAPVDAMDEAPAAPTSSRAEVMPSLPTRFERQPPVDIDAFPAAFTAAPGAAMAGQGEGRLRLRLFGKAAAHTLEATPHRRAGDFLGVHVVSIDSAHALSAGGGYDWQRKLVLQLTPEEMPAVISTLIGITPSVRFCHHGADRSKFVELRRQEGGLVLITGEHAAIYSAPVPTATIYYMLDLFCRAMCMDGSGRSASDILALVKAAHGF